MFNAVIVPPPLPPAAREADVKNQPPNDIEVAEINPNEPVEVTEPLMFPTLTSRPFGAATFNFAYQIEGGGQGSTYNYNDTYDSHGNTGLVNILHSVGNDNDQCFGGRLKVYNPASTTFVKQFDSRIANLHALDFTQEVNCCGHINTTSAITGLQFAMSSGNIDSGTIKLIGYRT